MYRAPDIYTRTQERRCRDALAAAERQARAGQKRIQDAIDQNGERMSEEGKGLLRGLADILQGAAQAMGGR